MNKDDTSVTDSQDDLPTMEDVRARRMLKAVVRLAALNGRGRYILGAGTNNPNSPTPFSWKNGVYASDCSRAVCWALQVQPGGNRMFPEYEGDINVDSMMLDAGLLPGGKGGGKFFRARSRENVKPGTLIVFSSIRAKEIDPTSKTPQKRVRIGHVGLVAGWEGLVDPGAAFVEDPGRNVPWDGKLSSLVTVECGAMNPAIRFRRNRSFLNDTGEFRGQVNEKWAVRFLEYVGP